MPETDAIEPGVLAGEYALGVLEGAALVAAQQRLLSDRDFADEVEWWRHRLACLAEAAGEFEPSPLAWQAIERRLEGAREGDGPAGPLPLERPAARGVSGWGLGLGMAGAAAIAAALTFVLVQPAGGPTPAPVPTSQPTETQAGERLIAQLASEDGAITLAGLVDAQSGRLDLSTTGLTPAAGQAAELWVVPAGGAPQSLGLIPADGRVARELTAAERAALIEGASLAVTYENAADAPHPAPTTDILLIGGLTRV